MHAEDSTHLLVLFDDSGTITSVGEINQNEMDRGTAGRVFLTAEGRHFAQLELTDDLRTYSHEVIMTRYFVDHFAGANATIVLRGAAAE